MQGRNHLRLQYTSGGRLSRATLAWIDLARPWVWVGPQGAFLDMPPISLVIFSVVVGSLYLPKTRFRHPKKIGPGFPCFSQPVLVPHGSASNCARLGNWNPARAPVLTTDVRLAGLEISWNDAVWFKKIGYDAATSFQWQDMRWFKEETLPEYIRFQLLSCDLFYAID